MPEYTNAPTVPGWYECRHVSFEHRGVVWWNGRNLLPYRDDGHPLVMYHYTDFSLLVPAVEVRELRELLLRVSALSGEVRAETADYSWDDLLAVIREIDAIALSALAASEAGKDEA